VRPPSDGVEAIDWAMVREDPDALIEAVSTIYHEYVERVYRYCYTRVGNATDAEDLTSQIFTQVLENLSQYRHRGHFAAWLFTIAHRRVVDHYRRSRDEVSLEASGDALGELWSGPQADPLRQTIRSEARQHLIELIKSLRDKDRELLRLRFAADLTYREMAQVLGRTEGAVKMATHRLLRRLQAGWEEENND
jgi:RNA polymerase sigma-70 factor (ECF subfamily)